MLYYTLRDGSIINIENWSQIPEGQKPIAYKNLFNGGWVQTMYKYADSVAIYNTSELLEPLHDVRRFND